MGVQTRMILYAPSANLAQEATRAAFGRIDDLNSKLSSYLSKSELNRLCRKAGEEPIPVSHDLFYVLERAREIGRRTDGAFDITIGPFIELWRETQRTGQLPSRQELKNARRKTGWQLIKLHPSNRTVELRVPGMQLNLGGIAKGYILDEALKTLRNHDIERALVEAGGDIVVGASPPNAAGWTVGVALTDSSERSLLLKHQAIATSGDTEQYVDVDGQRYSHIVDPATGLGLTTRIAVTVVAPTGLWADSYSTAISVLGPERGSALAQARHDLTAYIRTAPADSTLRSNMNHPPRSRTERDVTKHSPSADSPPITPDSSR